MYFIYFYVSFTFSICDIYYTGMYYKGGQSLGCGFPVVCGIKAKVVVFVEWKHSLNDMRERCAEKKPGGKTGSGKKAWWKKSLMERKPGVF